MTGRDIQRFDISDANNYESLGTFVGGAYPIKKIVYNQGGYTLSLDSMFNLRFYNDSTF
jgi:hypothetical protein